ncbi:MAG: hypothetical protein QOE94_1930 [Mycobacterium sp.]|jgi:hypothetical protein|nr:hypothetical protein [Mycobacterium sp.]MDT7760927.1 hypothetical protein [Mycobacterium sp.]
MSWRLSSQSVSKNTIGQCHSGKVPKFMTALSAGLSITFSAVYPAGVAHASPSDDDGTGQCTFVLSQPKVIQVSGLSLVSATMRPGPCTIHATPNLSVVCLSATGSGTQGECASKNGQDPAEVRYPYQPGTTYVVRGQGCASTFVPPYTLCQDFGPTQITL